MALVLCVVIVPAFAVAQIFWPDTDQGDAVFEAVGAAIFSLLFLLSLVGALAVGALGWGGRALVGRANSRGVRVPRAP